MTIHQKVGSVLKEARESRRLSIHDTVKDTNITPRYLNALESNDFSIFPSQTYAVGFLTNYGEYLNLDVQHLVNLFRIQQIDTTQTPVEELTKSSPLISFFNTPLLRRSMKIVLLFVPLTGLIVFLYSFLDWGTLLDGVSSISEAEVYCKGKKELRIVSIPPKGSPPQSETLSLRPPDALQFMVNNQKIRLCLNRIKTEGNGIPSVGSFHARINDSHNFNVEARESESFSLNNATAGLEKLSQGINIRLVILSDFSVRIALEANDIDAPSLEVQVGKEQSLGEVRLQAVGETKAVGEAIINSDNSDRKNDKDGNDKEQVENQKKIQITLEFLENSYIEWTQDGKTYRGRMIQAGEVHVLEAEDRLGVKIGNGGGVRIRKLGARPRLAGPPARIVKLEYRRVFDPLDPEISQIRESIKVVE